jgi:hypothetical protein
MENASVENMLRVLLVEDSPSDALAIMRQVSLVSMPICAASLQNLVRNAD